MPEKHGGIDSAQYRGNPEAYAEALKSRGDRLVLLVGSDGFTRVDERSGRRLIFRCFVPHDEARKIAEDFDGEVEWK